MNTLDPNTMPQEPTDFLECLDLHLRVEGLPHLDQTTIDRLGSGDTPFTRVSHPLTRRLLGGGALGGNSFRGRHGQSVLFITNDWTVSIQSIDMYKCVSAMCALLNTITSKLGTTFSIEVITTPDGDEVTLEGLMEEVAYKEKERLRKEKIREIIIGAIAGAVLGAMLSAVACWIAGQL